MCFEKVERVRFSSLPGGNEGSTKDACQEYAKIEKEYVPSCEVGIRGIVNYNSDTKQDLQIKIIISSGYYRLFGEEIMIIESWII
jgi:hypothetical protein